MDIKINNLTWTIREVETRSTELVVNGNQCFGVCKHYTQEILIDETLKPDAKLQVLKHELTHAFIRCCLLDYQEHYTEEDMCEFVALYSEQINNIAKEYFNGTLEKYIKEYMG